MEAVPSARLQALLEILTRGEMTYALNTRSAFLEAVPSARLQALLEILTRGEMTYAE